MCKVIAIANQKGGVGKTTTTVNLGIGLVRAGKKVLLIDADSQGSLTASLGFAEPDSLEVTLATNLAKIMNEEEFHPTDGILYHEEDVDIVPCNIELSGLEVSMVNAMRREYILKEYVDSLKDQYDAMKHQGVQGNSLSTMSKETGENAKKIQRYIWLARLSDDLLELVDAKKLPMAQAIDISFLEIKEQQWVLDAINDLHVTPSMEQSAEIKNLSQKQSLEERVVRQILSPKAVKPKPRQVTFKAERLNDYFPDNYSEDEIEDIIITLLEEWKRKGEEE